MKTGMEQALITGISTGQGSSWIADQLMKAAEIPEQRALLIARTEVNRAYRQANWEQMQSSRAVRGYRRMCYKDTACLACLMLDGEFYPIDSEPCDHPNGKCSFVPVTRHWDPANMDGWQSGRDWFMEQDEATQRRLMGPGRFDLWKQSGVDPRDMVYIKPNDIWGGSPAIRSLEDMRFITANISGGGVKLSINIGSRRQEEPENEKNDRKNQPTSVNWDYVNTTEYHEKFKGITGNTEADETLYNKAIDILRHRQNSEMEDMYLVDIKTGKVVGTQTHSKTAKEVSYNESLTKAAKKYRGRLISIHNHPNSAPPSANDFGSNYKNNYLMGIIPAHDGTIYVYNNNKLGINFPFELWDRIITHYSGIERDRKLNELSEQYGISWKKL